MQPSTTLTLNNVVSLLSREPSGSWSVSSHAALPQTDSHEWESVLWSVCPPASRTSFQKHRTFKACVLFACLNSSQCWKILMFNRWADSALPFENAYCFQTNIIQLFEGLNMGWDSWPDSWKWGVPHRKTSWRWRPQAGSWTPPEIRNLLGNRILSVFRLRPFPAALNSPVSAPHLCLFEAFPECTGGGCSAWWSSLSLWSAGVFLWIKRLLNCIQRIQHFCGSCSLWASV